MRQFGLLALVVFGALAAAKLSGDPASLAGRVCAVLALGIGVPALVHPPAMRWVFVGWMMAAFPIGWLISHLMLGIVFYLLVTPIAALFRIAGRDRLALRRRGAASLWVERPSRTDPSSYFRQY
ncbi:MAG TPA: hypothetical protein DEH78_03410 [Solibacterales bacterium]|nr:hypothetical protein [Bryobacterales bacterium]